MNDPELASQFQEVVKPLKPSVAEVVAGAAGMVALTGAAAIAIGVAEKSPELVADGIILSGGSVLGFVGAGVVKVVSYFSNK